MPKAIRAFVDLSQGHCFNPAPCLTGSSDLIINGLPAVRVTDAYVSVHVCGDSAHNMGIAAEGSTTVFNNGLGLHCDAHIISCGDVADNGSDNVIIDSLSSNSSTPNADNTVGYTVNRPVIIYPNNYFSVVRQLGGGYCRYFNGFNINSPPSPSVNPGVATRYDTIITPEWYTPLVEEDTGVIFKDKTVPVSITINPQLPQGFIFNPTNGQVSLDLNNTGAIVPATQFTVTITNFVESNTFKFWLETTQAGFLFTCEP